MGTPFAVCFACIYMSELEFEILESFRLLHPNSCYLFYRYIDDIFAIFTTRETAEYFIISFNSARKGVIKLLMTHIGESVVFLDITISKGERYKLNGRLDVSLYQKPANSYLYLPPSSHHTSAVFKFTIISELRRYRINCSADSDFSSYKSLFYDRLIARGYTHSYLDPLMHIHFDRAEILADLIQKRKPSAVNNPLNHLNCINKQNKSAPLVFKTFNTPRENQIDLRSCLATGEEIWQDPDSEFIFTERRNPIICFKRTKNLKELLIPSRYKFAVNNNNVLTAPSKNPLWKEASNT